MDEETCGATGSAERGEDGSDGQAGARLRASGKSGSTADEKEGAETRGRRGGRRGVRAGARKKWRGNEKARRQARGDPRGRAARRGARLRVRSARVRQRRGGGPSDGRRVPARVRSAHGRLGGMLRDGTDGRRLAPARCVARSRAIEERAPSRCVVAIAQARGIGVRVCARASVVPFPPRTRSTPPPPTCTSSRPGRRR